MKIIKDNFENIQVDDKLAVALGTFDGLHWGHKKIINETVKYAKKNGIKSAVLTFDKIPISVINTSLEIKVLMENDVKCQTISELGVDYLIFIEFNEKFSKVGYEDFIKFIMHNLNAVALFCGYNYTFGYMGMGNTKTLEKYKNKYGYDLIVIDRVVYKGHNISSSIIRDKISKGKMKEANELLGYKYFIKGEVIEGNRLGNKLGFPTANIRISENLALKNGVYATYTYIDENKYKSITNIGHNPTVEKDYRVAETYVFNFQGNLYSKNVKIEFEYFIRDEKKFPCIDELKKQVNRDINSVMNLK